MSIVLGDDFTTRPSPALSGILSCQRTGEGFSTYLPSPALGAGEGGRRPDEGQPLSIPALPPEIDKFNTMQQINPKRYAIVIEKTATGFSAFVPDLPGFIATGRSRSEVKSEMKSAIRFHIDGLKEDGPRRRTLRSVMGVGCFLLPALRLALANNPRLSHPRF